MGAYKDRLDALWAAHTASRTDDAPTVVSTFAGGGGSSLGYGAAGFRELLAVEWDKHAAMCLRRNFPEMQVFHGDIAKVDPAILDLDQGELDVFDGSPPCFRGDVLVTSVKGQVPISDLRPGDLVLTHMGRWRPAVAIGSKMASTVVLRGQGHPALEATPNHPIYSRQRLPRQAGWTEPDWTPAADIQGRYWAVPSRVDALPVPPVGGRGADLSNPDLWWMVGRWLGDGWVRIRRRRHDAATTPAKPKEALRTMPAPCVRCGKPARPHGRYPNRATAYCSDACNIAGKRERMTERGSSMGDSVLICCSFKEADELRERLAAVAPATGTRAGSGELRWRDHAETTTQRFETHHNGLADWLAEHFGRGAENKQIPSWALGMPREHRQALLDGLLSADGSTRKNGHRRITTVSRRLAFSLRMLVESLGNTTTVHWSDLPATSTIEGREVAQRGFFQVGWMEGETKHVRRDDAHTWGYVREITPGADDVRVWNIEVAEDHSYVVEGVVVHNCQGFSTAGKRQIGDPRNGLFREYVRLLDAWQPKVFVMENVSGMVKGRMRSLFAEILTALKQAGPGYRVVARLVDCGYFGVATMRQRMIFVGVREDLALDPVHPAPQMRPPVLRDALEDLGDPGLILHPKGGITTLAPLVPPGRDGADVLHSRGARRAFFNLQRAHWDRQCWTITKSMAPGRHGIMHPDENRFLSSREICRIQGFPDPYDWGDSRLQDIWARVGNSVPPPVMLAVASTIRDRILTPARTGTPALG